MKRLSLILTLCILLISIGFAQKPKKVRFHLETTVDSLLWDLTLSQKQHINQLTNDSLQFEIKVSELNKELAKCRNQIKDDSTSIAKLKNEIAENKKLITDKNEEIKRRQKEMDAIADRADSAYVIMAKSYIYTRYLKDDIDFAINSLNKIKNPKIRKDYDPVLQLLKTYEKFNDDFLKILNEAQNDENRDSKGLEDKTREFSNKYIEKIKSMDYYKNYYKQYWSIKYLDDKIDAAIALLENNKRALKKVDFSALINELK